MAATLTMVDKATRLNSPHLSLSHTNTHTPGCAPPPSVEQECSLTLGQMVFRVMYMCESVCVCVCCRWCLLRPPWCTGGWDGLHRGAADWRPLGVTRDKACEVDMRDVSWRPVRSEEEMLTGAPR